MCTKSVFILNKSQKWSLLVRIIEADQVKRLRKKQRRIDGTNTYVVYVYIYFYTRKNAFIKVPTLRGNIKHTTNMFSRVSLKSIPKIYKSKKFVSITIYSLVDLFHLFSLDCFIETDVE